MHYKKAIRSINLSAHMHRTIRSASTGKKNCFGNSRQFAIGSTLKNAAFALGTMLVQLCVAGPAGAASQAGGLPDTNSRVATLEAAVASLHTDLAAEIAARQALAASLAAETSARQAADSALQSTIANLHTSIANAIGSETAARQAADTALSNAISSESAARQAADTALSSQVGAAQNTTLYVTEGSVDAIQNATVTVATMTVPAGSYFILATTDLLNALGSGDANARCVLRVDGFLKADTSDLSFPVVFTFLGGGAKFGSHMILPLQTNYTTSNPAKILVECNESKGDNGGLNAYVQISALRVGKVEAPQ